MNHNLFEAFRTATVGVQDQPFISTRDGKGYTYGQAWRTVNQLAAVLRRQGISPGQRVAVQVDNSPEAVLLYLACLQIGGVYLPLNPGYTQAELDYLVGDAEPSLIVCRPQARPQMQALASDSGSPAVATLGNAGDGSLLELAASARADDRIAPCSRGDLAAILYTSGTTGRPKGAMLTHGNLASNARTLRDYWQFCSQDRLIHALPLFHTHGLFVACNVTLMAGASMILLPGFDVDTVIDLMADGTVLMGVPTFYTRLLQSDRLCRNTAGNMRLFTSGSAPLLASTHAAFAQATGHAILERYGMTETNMITSNPYCGDRKPGTVGVPLPGIDLRMVDRETGEPVPDGEIGLIKVRGPNVFKGYWRMPEKTREKLHADGFFSTGDLGMIDQQGYVHLVGRDKDLVITGGYNVYPKEIELVLDQLAGVAESAVIGLPHPDLGEGVAAVVVREPDAGTTEQSILAVFEGTLARYKQPRRIFFVDALPRNAMGKIQKNQLRDRFRQAFD